MAKLRVSLPRFLAAALLIVAAASYGVANSQSANGKYDTDGDGLIEVSSLEQLDAIRYDLDGDGQADAESNRDAHAAAFPVSGSETVCVANCNGYELARSLDFDDPGNYASGTVNDKWTSGDGWLPLGLESSAIFNGNGHTISNLYINRTTALNNPGAVGLFGMISGAIRKIGLVDVDVTGVHNAGGLVGRIVNGTISGSYATGSVSGESEVGGLVGSHEIDGTISDSYATCSVLGNSNVGGLAGAIVEAAIGNSYATGKVSGESSVGGLVGYKANGRIRGSYATGNISGVIRVGGLVGDNSGSGIIASYATGDVSGKDVTGGLVGWNHGLISASYAISSVEGESEVGGLVGVNRARISAGYATGSVAGLINIGGLIGNNTGSFIVSASYSTGNVSGDENVGGLIGSNSGTVIGGFWDTQTSGKETGVGNENSTGVVGKTTVELQSPTGYTDVYAAWRIDIDNADQDFDQSTGVDDLWDFGTSSQYPVVKADVNGDGVATWQEFGNQRPQPPAQMPTPGAADSNARPPAEVFGELVQAGLLVSVWRYHNATQSWDAYFPSVPAELNDLTHAAPQDIVWVEVTETTQFQGRTLRKGWNLISLK